MGIQTNARARLIAQSLENRPQMMGLGFGSIVAIIIELLPVLINCFDPDDGPQSQEYVSDRYTESDAGNDYRGYDKRLVKAMARRAKQAARRRRSRVTWSQAYEMAFAALDDIRTGDAHQASMAISENHDFLDSDLTSLFRNDGGNVR
jgi:hypothetical protein